MPTKPVKRATLEPQELFVAFKIAFETYKSYMEDKNYIGAAVVAFSIVEDRVKAMYVVRLKYEGKPIPKKFKSFGIQVDKLLASKDINQSTSDDWKAAAIDRNELFHKAMFNLDAFDAEVCKNFLKQAREADKARRNQQKNLKL